MKTLRDAIEGGNLLLDISGSSIESIFDQVLTHLVDSEAISAEHRNAVLNELIANESATNSALGILFPLFIAVLVPMRMLAGKFIKEEHLQALDADEIPEDETTQHSG